MELTPWKERLPNFLKKYKYAILILLIGIFFLLIPEEKSEEPLIVSNQQPQGQTLSTEEQLSEILSMVHGAGEVRVMLTVANGEEYLYQTNTSISTSANGSDERNDTVTVTDSQRNDSGLLRQINPPVYLGAVVICQGADNPSVRLAITEAVARLTGLGTDKITVLKMK